MIIAKRLLQWLRSTRPLWTRKRLLWLAAAAFLPPIGLTLISIPYSIEKENQYQLREGMKVEVRRLDRELAEADAARYEFDNLLTGLQIQNEFRTYNRQLVEWIHNLGTLPRGVRLTQLRFSPTGGAVEGVAVNETAIAEAARLLVAAGCEALTVSFESNGATKQRFTVSWAGNPIAQPEDDLNE